MKYISSLLLSCLLFTSCEKVFFEEDLSSTRAVDNFEYLWDQCDKKYSFFDLKEVDWNAIKLEYSAKIFEEMTEDSLFNVLADMLRELKDGHVNLVSDFNVSFFPVPFLGPDNFDWRIIEENYLPENYYRSGPFQHDFIDNEEIGYIRFAQFTGTVDAINLDFVLNRYQNTKGLILDLRENGGGSVSDVFNILERFVQRETLLYHSRIKIGEEHNDFSEAMPVYVKPYDGVRYQNKVAILIDRSTYSAGSFTSLAAKALPNMVLIGDTTGGGLGLPNGGQLPNGWNYRFSITQALTLDKRPDYENGVPPDISILFDWSDLTKDEVLERAIMELQ